MVRVVAVVGYRGAGKTRVVEGLVKELSRRGYAVATIKHVVGKKFSIDHPGKDTWRHAEAGASVVVSLSPREVATIERKAARLDEVLRRFEGLDFIIMEGFKKSEGFAKIAAARGEAELSELADEWTMASVGAKKKNLRALGFGRMRELADLVERKAPPLLPGLDCEHCGYESCREFALAVLAGKMAWDRCPTMRERTVLSVDGRRVYLNPFMQELVAGLIEGLLSSLKGAKGKRVELRVIKHVG